MQCFSCKQELTISAYVVMPLLNSSSCMNCWDVAEEMYNLTIISYAKNGQANA